MLVLYFGGFLALNGAPINFEVNSEKCQGCLDCIGLKAERVNKGVLTITLVAVPHDSVGTSYLASRHIEYHFASLLLIAPVYIAICVLCVLCTRRWLLLHMPEYVRIVYYCILACYPVYLLVCVTVTYYVCIPAYPQDDALATVRSVTTQLKDLDEERERTENRLRVLQKSLGEAEEGERMFLVDVLLFVSCQSNEGLQQMRGAA